MCVRGTHLLVRVGGVLVPTKLVVAIIFEHRLQSAALLQLVAAAAPRTGCQQPSTKLLRYAPPERWRAAEHAELRRIYMDYQQLQSSARGSQPACQEQHESSHNHAPTRLAQAEGVRPWEAGSRGRSRVRLHAKGLSRGFWHDR